MVDRFLEELTELTKKYNIVIGGCGCCGSPFLYDLQGGKKLKDNIWYSEDKESYEVDSW